MGHKKLRGFARRSAENPYFPGLAESGLALAWQVAWTHAHVVKVGLYCMQGGSGGFTARK